MPQVSLPSPAPFSLPRRSTRQSATLGHGAAGNPVMTLYLGVFLGVFCFFVLLVGTTETAQPTAPPQARPRAAAVAEVLPAAAPEDRVLDGDAASGRSVLNSLAPFAAAASPSNRGAPALQFTLPQALIFADSGTEVRALAVPLLDDVVATLASARAGGAATAELILMRPPGATSVVEGDALLLRRARALESAFRARGAATGHLAIGVSGIPGDALLLTIRRSPLPPDSHHGG